MANRNDGVRAFAASASSVLLEHDYSGYFRNNNDNNKNVNDNKENVFQTNNKFHGNFDAVEKWADSVIMRVPIGHDRRKIVDREITIHKVKYPFLPEQQIRGKVYRKFGIPTVMGGVPSRVVASFSGSSAKDRPKRRRRDPKKSNDRGGAAAASQDSRAARDEVSGREVEERCLVGSQDHPQRLLTRPTFAEAAQVRQEMSPPTVSSRASELSNDGSFLGSEESRSPSRAQKLPGGVEPSLESPDLDSSETQQLVASLDLDRLSLDDEIEPTLFRKSSVVLDRASTSRVASSSSLEAFETAAYTSLEDVPTQIYASASGPDVVRANTKKNHPRNSSFGRRDSFLRKSLGKSRLDASEFLLLERVRSAGETFVRKFDRTSSSREERTKDQRTVKKSSSYRLVDHLDLGVKKGQPEVFVSRCSFHEQPEVLRSRGSTTHEQPEKSVFRCSFHEQPEVLHSRGSTAHEQPELLDSRGSATGEQPEVLDSRSSSHGVVNYDHFYSGSRAPEGTGSEKRRAGKRRRIEATVNCSRMIRNFGSLKSAGSKIRLTGKVRSSEDKENATYVSHCVEVGNETKNLGEYSLLDDEMILPTVGASPLGTVKPKQPRAGRPVATDVSAGSKNATGNIKVSTLIGEPEVEAYSPKNLNDSLTASSPASFVHWATDTTLLPVDLLSNHCSEYDQELAVEPKPPGHADEFPSCEKNSLKECLRVSSSEIAKSVEKILDFLDEDCADF